jgi:hypothetical protein
VNRHVRTPALFSLFEVCLHGFSKNFRGINNLVTVALQSQSYLSSKISPNCVNIPSLWRISVKQDANSLPISSLLECSRPDNVCRSAKACS